VQLGASGFRSRDGRNNLRRSFAQTQVPVAGSPGAGAHVENLAGLTQTKKGGPWTTSVVLRASNAGRVDHWTRNLLLSVDVMKVTCSELGRLVA
jgi:hypothetical protein